MKRRPMVLVFLGLVSGILLGIFLKVHTVPAWSLGGIGASIIVFVSSSLDRYRLKTAAIFTGLAFFGIALYGASYFQPASVDTTPEALNRATGRVVTYPVTSKQGTELVLEPEGYRGRIKVFSEGDTGKKIDYGDRLTISGDFRTPKSFRGFDYGEYLRKKDIWSVIYDAEIVSSQPGYANPAMELGWWVRKRISRQILKQNEDQGEFLVALIFGARDLLAEDVERAFTETGLAHLLAASGLHLGLILGVTWAILNWLGMDRGKIYLSSLPLVFMYLLTVGFKLPLLRASVIYLFGGAHFYLEKKGVILSDWYDRYQALASAGLLLALYDPQGVTTAGYQLSFGATFAIALYFDPIRERLPERPHYLFGILAASLAAQLGVGPVLAAHFHRVHPWAPLTNLVAIPWATGILYLGLLSVPLGNLPLIGPGIINLEKTAIRGFKWVITMLSEVPLTSLEIPAVTSTGLLSYFLILFWLKWRMSRGGKRETLGLRRPPINPRSLCLSEASRLREVAECLLIGKGKGS
ncbi:MAG: ComEC/Rec2 family competence protein [Candidatus Acetothermia bacterium]